MDSALLNVSLDETNDKLTEEELFSVISGPLPL